MSWPRRERIGPDACPLFDRWTLVGWDRGKGRDSRLPVKVMIHHFMPNGIERDLHCHPWDFVTFVLRGAYYDATPDGGEVVRAPTVRRRSAEHVHRTMTGPSGCWTLVVAAKPRRRWYFYRDGERIPWREYLARHGGDRC